MIRDAFNGNTHHRLHFRVPKHRVSWRQLLKKLALYLGLEKCGKKSALDTHFPARFLHSRRTDPRVTQGLSSAARKWCSRDFTQPCTSVEQCHKP